MPARVHLIVNPVAGACQQAGALGRLVRRLRNRGLQVETHTTCGPGDARRMAVTCAADADAVIAVGGDGTVCEVSNGLFGQQVPLIIWPTGTENLVARSLGFRPDVDLAIACVERGEHRPLDVGVANGHSFLVVVGVGFDAEVVRRVVDCRRGHITHFSYAAPLWRTFWEHRFPPLRVFNDGHLYWEGRGLVFVGNMARYALGLPVVRDARPDDGLLDLCIFSCRDRRQLIAHSVRTLLRRHIEHPDVRYVRVRQVRVESPQRVPVELDGECAGFLPVEIGVRPAAIRVCLPPVDLGSRSAG
jgi:YegS/Rv2252/BmrU family lipid kinase